MLQAIEPKQPNQPPIEIIILSPILLCCCCIVFLVTLLYQKKRKNVRDLEAKEWELFLQGDPINYNPQMTLKEQIDRLFYAIEYEFAKEKLVLQERLGDGAFGVVWKATAVGISANEAETTVAVKMLRKKHNKDAIRSLIAELKIMVHLGQHLNVVNLLGAVTKNIVDGELMVIVEYCPYGNLLNFLRKNRTNFEDQLNHQSFSDICYDSTLTNSPIVGSSISNDATKKAGEDKSNRSNQRKNRLNENIYYKVLERQFTTTDLRYWASQIAAGMEYLASRQVLHGDLAARNVLLCDDNVVKICDFGLSRSLCNKDKYMKNIAGDRKVYLPVRWLALESMFDGVFSTHSDVWAYGIVLWELFSLGNVPYPGIDIGPEFCKMLREGLRMECPPFSNQEIYDIMLSCWKVRPDSRPSFRELRKQFNGMLPQEMQDHYLELNEPYLAMNAARTNAINTESLSNLDPPEEVAPLVPCVEKASLGYIEMKSHFESFTTPAGYVDMTKSRHVQKI
uniref:Protein kinase domain-containing protein n=1 Tax=Anopheles albimanus TaxID=7167 RepID=A0A8W7K7P8_ANOAL